MDEKPSTAEAADSPRRRRVPPPTIDLAATDVSAQAEDAAGSRASETPESPAESASAEAMKGSPRAKSTSSAPPPAGSSGTSRRVGSQIVAGMLGAAIALAVAAAAWLLLGPGNDHDAGANARLTRIELQLDVLSHRSSIPGPAVAPAAPADTKALGELTDRLADLNHRNDEIMAAAQVARDRADAAAKSLADVAQQLTKLNAERARAPEVQRADLDALASRLASVESATKAISQQLSRMAGAAAAGNTRQAVLAIALNAAVERGAPYARELAAIDPSVASAAAIAALKPFADTGVPSAAALARELAPLLPAARAAAEAPPPAGGFFARLQSNAERLIRVRPIGQVPGDEPGEVLARLDAKATQGDIAGALAESGKLSAAVRAPLDPWIKRAELRAAALAAAATLATRSLDVIRRPGQSGQGAQDAPGTQGTAAQ